MMTNLQNKPKSIENLNLKPGEHNVMKKKWMTPTAE